MNRLARWIIRLYPGSWRARYGDEMDALLSDTGADARIVGDLARGGMRMQLKAWPFPLLALALGLTGLLAGAGISWLIPNTYASEATLRITNEQSISSANEEIMRMVTAVMSRTSLSRIIQQDGLYRDEQRTTPLEDVIDEMRRAIYVELMPARARSQGALFNIRFAYGDRGKARETVGALIARFQEEAAKSETWAGQRAEKMAVVDIANLPVRPVSPTQTFVIAVGFLGGLVLAAMLRLLFRRGRIRRRFATFAVAMGIAGLLLAVAAEALNFESSIFWDNHYRSTATAVLPAAQPTDVDAVKQQVLSRTSLSEIVEDPRLRLYSKQQATTPLEDILQLMKNNISVGTHTYGDGTFVSLSFEYPDRFKAQQTVTALIDRFGEIVNRGIASRVNSGPAPKIGILDQPSTPVNPVKPNRYLISGMGGFSGMLLAAVISLLRRRWKPENQLPVKS